MSSAGVSFNGPLFARVTPVRTEQQTTTSSSEGWGPLKLATVGSAISAGATSSAEAW
eukprot:CAMPEP_0176055414 /NCGR_PEP_ID=MMETSP0120_2-20121206/27588_1 /TAXON_ID=160619 /ORGANISM="Kryptoperidinium foliaceum, Strain CCMP 1326" /LENGTH=56 /DNA_ID=CAMNT_0017388909 /DNA_START=138 /DNA_END=305 /DNA_ORIENTATION=-